jgi:hypothetical protein
VFALQVAGSMLSARACHDVWYEVLVKECTNFPTICNPHQASLRQKDNMQENLF